MDAFAQLVQRARLRLLQMHFESRVGHIGGNLSCLDTLMTLYHQVLLPQDAFVLSKGHAAGALYVTLWSRGVLADEDLQQFHRDNTRLSGHPAPGFLPQIPFATGSLGHGLPLAGGMALGKRLKGEAGRVFCLTSDGEWEEGSNWEALLFAAHHRVAPLTIIVDANGLQGFGSTAEVSGLEPLAAKFRAFNLPVTEVDGHDLAALECALNAPAAGARVLVARTQKGRGVSYMEDRMEWHYLPMTPAQYQQAVKEQG